MKFGFGFQFHFLKEIIRELKMEACNFCLESTIAIRARLKSSTLVLLRLAIMFSPSHISIVSIA